MLAGKPAKVFAAQVHCVHLGKNRAGEYTRFRDSVQHICVSCSNICMRLTIVVAFLCLVNVAWSQSNGPWKSLFDGKTFKGWLDPAQKMPPGDSWTIEDGALVALPNPRLREDLFTQDKFTNFELEWDWRIERGGNSGVKYGVQRSEFIDMSKVKSKEIQDQLLDQLANHTSSRESISPTAKGKDYVIGYEFQLIDDSGHPDARVDARHSCGALYGMVAPSKAAAKAPGEWNHARLIVQGDAVEHWLNGVNVVKVSLKNPKNWKGLEERWGLSHPVYKMLTQRPQRATPIVLQNHNDKTWFRNLRIRELQIP
jgi:hypothetical protein